MFSQFSSFSVPKFGFGKSLTSQAISIPRVKVYNIETEADKRGRSLKHLIKLNHTNFSVLYHDLQFHNHSPHILGSAYLLGGSADHLNDVYEDEAKHAGHEPWKDSPSEIAEHDYRDFLGLKEYQRAWVDFFEDQLVVSGSYDWRSVVTKFLFADGSTRRPNPISIFKCIVGGLGHPLIHLGYAYELNSRDIAMEAMALAATCYEPQFASIFDNALPRLNDSAAPYATSNPFEILAKVNADSRFDKFKHAGYGNIETLFNDAALTSILIDHWAAWKITDPKKQFEQSQQLAAAILISSAPSVGGQGYDFFLVHLLTTSHAVRILLPEIDAQYHLTLVREWWLITLAVYIAQLRPALNVKHIQDFDLQGRTWQNVTDLALVGKHKFDAHYVKALRALKEAAEIWGDGDQYYLKAALKFGTEFEEWFFGEAMPSGMKEN